MSAFGLPNSVPPPLASAEVELSPPFPRVLREIPAPIPEPWELYRRLRARSRVSFLLESAPGPGRRAEFSFLGFDPVAALALREGRLVVNGERLDRLWSPP